MLGLDLVSNDLGGLCAKDVRTRAPVFAEVMGGMLWGGHGRYALGGSWEVCFGGGHGRYALESSFGTLTPSFISFVS